MDEAAANNHLEVIKWLHTNRNEGCTTAAMDNAAMRYHLRTAKWLHANRNEGCTTQAMDAAVSFEMVKWLHENRWEGCTVEAMSRAAMKEDFDTLLFLHANRPRAALSRQHTAHPCAGAWLSSSGCWKPTQSWLAKLTSPNCATTMPAPIRSLRRPYY